MANPNNSTPQRIYGPDRRHYTQDYIKEMKSEEADRIIYYASLGAQWIKGDVSLESLSQIIGEIRDYPTSRPDYREYTLRLAENYAGIYITTTKKYLKDGRPSPLSFAISIDFKTGTNIDKTLVEEKIALHPLVRGELIDGVRKETGIHKGYLFPPSPYDDYNEFSYSYRFVSNEELPYDIYAGLGYLRREALLKDGREDTLEHTTNLREIVFTRLYLNQEDLQQREDYKLKKMGSVFLRSGQICPLSGLWTPSVPFDHPEYDLVNTHARPIHVNEGDTLPRFGLQGDREKAVRWVWTLPKT